MKKNSRKPVLFFAFANERQESALYLRNLPSEARRIRAMLEPAMQDGLCEIIVRENVTSEDIFSIFQTPIYRNRIAVFHFGGHANGYQLLLQSVSGIAEAVHAAGLADFLGQQNSLQLVFLNGCSTEQQAEELLSANVPSVIATSQAIDDQVATDFAGSFYNGIASGVSIEAAYNEARSKIKTTRSGTTRKLYWGDMTEQWIVERWPWELYILDGSELTKKWNLPDAVDNPLYGLPPIPKQDLPESPFRYLQWYGREHAELFFGRGHQIRELYERITSPDTPPIILLFGQSGVGKSSLLEAGVIPRLESTYQTCYLRRDAVTGLTSTLRKPFQLEVNSDIPDNIWSVMEQQLKKPFILIIDQVEELYTRPNAHLPNELSDFLDVLVSIFRHPVRRPQGKLILGLRKEWLAEFDQQFAKRKLSRSRVLLERLDRRGIIEVINGPEHSERLQQQYGLTVESGLADKIADNLLSDRGSPVATTLQIMLTKFWDNARELDLYHPYFDQVLYQKLKQNGLLLSDFLDQQLEAIEKDQKEAVTSGLVIDLLAYHTTSISTARECSDTELLEAYSHCNELLSELIRLFKEKYLLSDASENKIEKVHITRLAHDILAPLVRKLFEESERPGQRAFRILKNRFVEWRDGRTGSVLDEADLVMVEAGIFGMRALTNDEKRLLEVSQNALKQKQDKAESQRERLSRITNKALMYESKEFSHMAKRKLDATSGYADIVTSQLLALEALPLTSSIPDRPYIEAPELILRETMKYPHVHQQYYVEKTDLLVSIDEDTSTILVHDGKAIFLPVPYERLKDFYYNKDQVGLVNFNRYFQHLALEITERTVDIWDIPSGSQIRTILGFNNRLVFMLLNDQGLLATVDTNKIVKIWGASDIPIKIFEELSEYFPLIAFSKGGHRIAISYGRRILVYNFSDKSTKEFEQSEGLDTEPLLVDFSENGKTLIAISKDCGVDSWDIKSEKLIGKGQGNGTYMATSIHSSVNDRILLTRKNRSEGSDPQHPYVFDTMPFVTAFNKLSMPMPAEYIEIDPEGKQSDCLALVDGIAYLALTNSNSYRLDSSGFLTFAGYTGEGRIMTLSDDNTLSLVKLSVDTKKWSLIELTNYVNKWIPRALDESEKLSVFKDEI